MDSPPPCFMCMQLLESAFGPPDNVAYNPSSSWLEGLHSSPLADLSPIPVSLDCLLRWIWWLIC